MKPFAVPKTLTTDTFELIAWAAVNRKGHYNASHVHPMATWSGVYYVDPGDQPESGPGAVLEFEHPIQAMVMNFFPGLLPSSLILRPEAGLIVLFRVHWFTMCASTRASDRASTCPSTHGRESKLIEDRLGALGDAPRLIKRQALRSVGIAPVSSCPMDCRRALAWFCVTRALNLLRR